MVKRSLVDIHIFSRGHSIRLCFSTIWGPFKQQNHQQKPQKCKRHGTKQIAERRFDYIMITEARSCPMSARKISFLGDSNVFTAL